MEQKTMGSFIAALRKANGMTQKALAEKLHVSDKSVSRWERSEGVPDLSLIPVIAEIFGVTCDELLRGERRPEAQRTEAAEGISNPKAEKQRKRIFAVCLSKYRTRSFISIGLSVAGLLAAMVCNFGFNRAYLGFFLGAAFCLAAVVCQAVFLNHAFLSVTDDDLPGAETGRFKRSVVLLAEFSFSFTAVLLAFSLPLALDSFDAYMGLTAGGWFLDGLLGGAAALLICGVFCYFLNAAFLKKEIYDLDEKEKQAYWSNHRLKRKCAVILLVIVVITAIGNAVVTHGGDPLRFVSGTSFDDYESFIEYMEQDILYYYNSADSSVQIALSPDTYYDEAGNVINEAEALRRTITAPDGHILCEYIDRNETVCRIRYSYHADTDDVLPITVFTYNDWKAAQRTVDLIHAVFAGVYCIEIAAAFLVYFRKKAR